MERANQATIEGVALGVNRANIHRIIDAGEKRKLQASKQAQLLPLGGEPAKPQIPCTNNCGWCESRAVSRPAVLQLPWKAGSSSILRHLCKQPWSDAQNLASSPIRRFNLSVTGDVPRPLSLFLARNR